MSDITAGFKDLFVLNVPADSPVQVGELTLPAGNYSIWAKLFVGLPASGDGFVQLRCRLQAGGDFDETIVTKDAHIAFASIALNVVHGFAEPGPVTLTAESMSAATDTNLQFIKITALEVGTISNHPM
jgi:hypothetical protein